MTRFGVMKHLKVLEEETMGKVFEIYIHTTPERLWEAIADRGMAMRLLPPEGYQGEVPESSGEQAD